MAYAHTPNPAGEWHDLVAHLRGTAELASQFATSFGAADLAARIALWHDLGKFNPEFQQYLAECHRLKLAGQKPPKSKIDHKAAGVKLGLPFVGPIALLIQGHHGGLQQQSGLTDWLREKEQSPAVDIALQAAHAAISDLEPANRLAPPAFTKDLAAREFFLRMLFSTLTDADFLDTERHFDGAKADLRGNPTTPAELWATLAAVQDKQIADAAATDVNRARAEIYHACVDAASQRPGFFRLTVPTGGGKTRSGLAFALRHAAVHGMKRVIVTVPFTTITEQTAKEYRKIFGEGTADKPIVLEHHSAARWQDEDKDRQKKEEGKEEDEAGEFGTPHEWSRLAAENWDAPIIVTTTVQLFESMFARSTSRCRKLHRLANSVIILDEAQALPAGLLIPILDGLRQLVANYGTTVVFSTATQPAFDLIKEFNDLAPIEIVPQPERYFTQLERVKYDWQADERWDWPQVAERMQQEQQVLTIVNTKQHALDLLTVLGKNDPANLHLSTLMCATHRRTVVAEVKERLAKNQRCRLVSTQLVEAGVDLDFPLVMRSVGPLDSIIQAAGRCNREGRLDRGQVIIFLPPDDKMPPGNYKLATQLTGVLRLGLGADGFDPNNPELCRTYFNQVFNTVNLDKEGIQRLRYQLDYPAVDKAFKMIEEDTVSVVVTSYGDLAEQKMVQDTIADLRGGRPANRKLLRQLQPFIVSVRYFAAQQYKGRRLIDPRELAPGLYEWVGGYDDKAGLLLEGGISADVLTGN